MDVKLKENRMGTEFENDEERGEGNEVHRDEEQKEESSDDGDPAKKTIDGRR